VSLSAAHSFADVDLLVNALAVLAPRYARAVDVSREVSTIEGK
jgi:hypothetical protein